MTPSLGVCSELSQGQWDDFPLWVMGKHDVFSPRRLRHILLQGPT